MHGPVPRQLPVDRLHNVQLPAGRPPRPFPDALPKQPKSRPDALLASHVVASKPDQGLAHRLLTPLGGKCVPALDPSRGPPSGDGTVPPGDDLKGLAPRKLNLPRVRAVGLQLVVDVQVPVNDVPV